MRRSALVQWLAVAGCVGAVFLAATRMPAINAGRKELNALGSESPLANTPPEYVFYIQAFGAFRGLIADVAFLRADQLKEEGRFYDAMQLAKWICDLQPHFPSVWEYAAWNMAWNISVTTFTPQERWNWVYNGVKLLRDQGLALNPRAINLYKQLAWIYNNKMSEPTDEQHYAYKTNWAWRMHVLLGPPPDPLAGLDAAHLADELKSTDDLDRLADAGRQTQAQIVEKRRRSAAARGEAPPPEPNLPNRAAGVTDEGEVSEYKLDQRAAEQRIRAIEDMPDRLADLYAEFPDARRMVGELRRLGVEIKDDELSEDDYWRQEGLAFALFKPYRELVGGASLLSEVARTAQKTYTDAARLETLDHVLGVRAGNAAGAALVRFLQKKVLREVYKLDPVQMRQVIEQFGPVDWRSVDAQSLYWVTKGLIATATVGAEATGDKTNTARIIFFSLRNLFLRNKMVFEPNPDNIHFSYLNISRDLNFVEPMHQAFIRYGPLFDSEGGAGGGAGEIFRAGHSSFLAEAVRLLYLSGREPEADRYYQYLRETYPQGLDGKPNPLYTKPLHDFVLDSFVESTEFSSLREIQILIDAWLSSAYNQLANRDPTTYARLVRAARAYHEKYMREKRDDPTWARQRLPDFAEMQVDALRHWLDVPPISAAATLHKRQLWHRAPLYLRQAVYDELAPGFKSECDLWNFDLAKVFPEPKGMDEYRASHAPRQRPPDMPEPKPPSGAPGGP